MTTFCRFSTAADDEEETLFFVVGGSVDANGSVFIYIGAVCSIFTSAA